MSDDLMNFEKRLTRIGSTRRRVARGLSYAPVVGPDGMVVVRPRRSGPSIPVKGLIYLILGFCLFKSVAIAHLGATGYAGHIDEMKQGTIFEQAGAWALQPDRVSVRIASTISPFIK
ncbi:hypothetical protein [Aquicoccus sp.]|uniref:hypothetical protein n=1 Tax=Aquicoccus sp. TaxID=2055851 RepID=UPI003567C952